MYFCTMKTTKRRMPAEWEPQSQVQLTWPHAATDWAPMLDEITATYREMVEAIERYEPVLTVNTDHSRHSSVNYQCPTNDTWARDHGFITLTDEGGGVRLLDFRFNGWGDKFPAELDNAINRRLYDDGVVRGEYVSQLNFVLEGGSIESERRIWSPGARPACLRAAWIARTSSRASPSLSSSGVMVLSSESLVPFLTFLTFTSSIIICS